MLKIALRAAVALAFGLPALAQGAVFVNEIHYDNSGTDTGEALEIVATAGEDLTQYAVTLYNGSSTPSAAVPYGTATPVPTGTTVTCGAGAVRLAVIMYPQDGLQNGASDGIALAQGSTVVQFISYEGVITASGGVANGLMSTDIGVSEASTAAVGSSLQLSGSNGAQASDFMWQPSGPATFAACNTGQTFASPVDNPPTVVSTDPPADATGVSPSTNITVVFSEAVSVTAAEAWYSINCATAGTQTASSSATSSTTYVINPDAPLPNNEACTLNLNADQITDLDGTPDQLDGNGRFTFTISQDDPPAVASTTPVDGATGIALNTTINIKFSEDVDVLTSSWYSIACTPSGAKTATVQVESASSYTIVPDAALLPGENCVVTIENTLVIDQDGTMNQTMVADYIFDFTTVPDNAPDVQTFSPANGANGVAQNANVVVTFTESVNVAAGAFAISCATSGAHTVVVTPAGPATTYTLNPDVDFGESESCTVTVESTAVTDVDGAATPMALDRTATFMTRAGTGTYYNSVDASSCQSLRTTLHALIDDHTVYPYTGSPTDVWTMIEAGDEDPSDPNRVLDVYFNKSFAKGTDRDNGTGVPQGTVFNREHTWPQSYGFSATNGNLGLPNAPRSDGHMIYASEKDWNADRGNKPYADCPPPGCSSRHTLIHPVTGGAGSDAACNYASGNCNWVGGSDGNTGSFEVWDARKGDTARAVLYMDIRYEGGTHGVTGQAEPDLIVTDNRNLIQITSASPAYMGLKATLIAWAAEDQPDAREQLRNDVIFSYQGNRNPFIDHPEWVAIAFETPCGAGLPDAIFANGFEN